MIMSADTEQKSKEAFNELDEKIRTTLLGATVKLSGKPLKASEFIGSGVLLYHAYGEVLLLTAKHNLSVFADLLDGRPQKSPKELTADFIKKVSIGYGGKPEFNGDPAKTAAISEITSIEPDEKDPWAYDVILLKSTDTDLIDFAEKNSLYSGPLSEPDLSFVLNPAKFLSQDNGPRFFQTGYGFVEEKAEDTKKTSMPTADKKGSNQKGRLQYRVTQPKANRTAPVFQQVSGTNYVSFTDAIQLNADANNSTAPGDSGGPLFVVTLNALKKPVYYVIGVSWGCDLATSRVPCPGKALRVNDISTSLDYCYRKRII